MQQEKNYYIFFKGTQYQVCNTRYVKFITVNNENKQVYEFICDILMMVIIIIMIMMMVVLMMMSDERSGRGGWVMTGGAWLAWWSGGLGRMREWLGGG